MSFVLRIAVYLPLLFLIALVVVAQHHSTVSATVRAAVERTVRWLVWSVLLLLGMLLLEWIGIGF